MGAIGGPDGPAVVFVSGSPIPLLLLPAVLAAAGLALFLGRRNK